MKRGINYQFPCCIKIILVDTQREPCLAFATEEEKSKLFKKLGNYKQEKRDQGIKSSKGLQYLVTQK